MTDLRQGILEVGNVRIYPGMCAAQLCEDENVQIRKGKFITRLYSRRGRDIQLSGVPFTAEVCFSDGRVWYAQLCPHLPEDEVPDYPDMAYQKRKWEICCAVLGCLLGDPQKQDAETVQYAFPWGRISCTQVLKGKNPYTDGNIRISYRMQEDR